jgi:anti-sigma regulatory factor (Ser/Thr protein kinase)
MQEPSTLRVKAVLKNVRDAMDFAAHRARGAGLDAAAVEQVQLAVDEACANVVEHAYVGLEPGDMEIVCGLDGPEFVVLVRDWGHRFCRNDYVWGNSEQLGGANIIGDAAKPGLFQ